MLLGIDATGFYKGFDGGKEQVLYNLLRGLEEINVGNQIIIICYQNRYATLKELIPSAKIITIEDIHPTRDSKSNIERLRARVIGMFHNLHTVPKLVRRYNPSLLFFPIYGTSWTKFSIPTVVLPHDIQTQSHPERFSKLAYYRFKLFLSFDFSLRDKIISISAFDKSEIEEFYPNYKHKLKQIYNPIFYEDVAVEKNRKGIVALNIVHHHKNLETLIDAFSKIKDKTNENLYLIGGINGYVESLQKRVEKLNLDSRVIFTGYVDEETKVKLLAQSRLYVNPSLFEGFGMTNVEAMIYGVPTLVSHVASVPEVTKGLCHYYYDVTNSDELAEKMLEVLSEDLDLDQLKKTSETIKAAYDYRNIAKQYWQFFESLVCEQDRK